MFYIGKIIRNIAYFYTTFEIPLSLISEVREQMAVFDYYKCGYFPKINTWGLQQQKLYPMATSVPSSFVSFFNFFSNFLLKLLAII